MSYTLRLTNGKILLTLADQRSDSVSTSLTLIGKNVNAYGADLNDNFVRLMENFANSVEPRSPLTGQLWFNTFEQRMYVYNNSNQFKPVGGPVLSAQTPTNLVDGDLWIDTDNQQLKYYYNGEIHLVGPEYNSSLGKSGVIVETITDSSAGLHSVSNIYSNDELLGIISKDSFVPSSSISSSSGITNVLSGINLKPGLKFVGTATNAERIGSILPSDLILSTVSSIQALNSPLDIFNDDGLMIGIENDLQLYVDRSNRVSTLALGSLNDFNLIVQSQSAPDTSCLYWSTSTSCLGVFNTNPTVGVDIISDVSIQGNLTVAGNLIYINTENLRIQDKVVELAYSDTPTDAAADQGGVILKGTTDKTIIWNAAKNAWVSNQDLELTSGKSYKINGVTVVTSNSLGSSITSAPGLTSVGNLTSATISQMTFTTSSIGLINSVPLILGTGLTTEVSVNNKRITNLGLPVSSNQAATKGYVDDLLNASRLNRFTVTIDVTGIATGAEDFNLNSYVVQRLEDLIPIVDPSSFSLSDGTKARVMVQRYISTAPGTFLTVNRAIKQYSVVGGVWTVAPYPTSGSPTNTVWSDGTW